MKKKKLLSLILTCAMVCASLAGCGGSSGGDTTTPSSSTVGSSADSNFKIFARIGAMSPDNSEKTLVKEMIANVPVTIEWIQVSGDDGALAERKNLIFGAGTDYPDAFMGAALSDYELSTYGSRGVLIPLEDYITPEIMPNLFKIKEQRPDAIAAMYMPDGHMYGLPTVAEMGFEKDGVNYQIASVRHMTMINKTWLDNLSLEMPTTIGELYTVLKAFKEQDPNKNGQADEIPVGFNNTNNFCGNLRMLYTAFGFTDFNDDHRNYKDGVVSFGALDPKLKDVVNTFNKWSNEGLLDIEGFTQDDSQYISKAKQGLYGVLTWWEIPEITGDFASDYIYLPPLKGDDGTFAFDICETSTATRDRFSVTSACKNPELLLKWVDQLYDPVNSMQLVYGPIGEFFNPEPDADGLYRMRELQPGETAGELKGKLEIFGPYAQLSDYYSEFWELEPRAQQRLDDIRDFWLPYVTNNTSFPMPVSYTEEEINTLNKMGDIKDYCNEMFAAWVKNGGADEGWDAYVKQLENMGVNEVVASWQAAADRYNANLK